MKSLIFLTISLLLSEAKGSWIWSIRHGLKELGNADWPRTSRTEKTDAVPQEAEYREIPKNQSITESRSPRTSPEDSDSHVPAQTSQQATQNAQNALDQVLFKYPSQFLTEPELDNILPIAPGSKLVKKQYGPIVIRANSSESQMFIPDFPKPCDGCFITAMQGDVTFGDGKRAYVANGVSLNQMTLYNTNGRDLICPGEIYPVPERLYATGDERDVVRINNGNSNWGIEIHDEARLSMVYHIENKNSKDEEVYLSMYYEVVDPSPEQAFRNVAMAWLDVMGCNDVVFPGNSGSFAVESPKWTSTVQGQLLFSSGHLSDGGAQLNIQINGTSVCTQNALYGRTLGYVEEVSKISHLSDISVCRDFGQINVGDEVSLVAKYDTGKYRTTSGLQGEMRPMRGSARIYIGL